MTSERAPEPKAGRATGWERFVCDPWRAAVLRDVTGLDAAPYAADPTPGTDGAPTDRAALLPPTFLVGQRVDAAALGVPTGPVRLNGGNWCRWEAPVRAGDVLERRTVLESVTKKTGRSGELVFYRLTSTYRRSGVAEVVARTSTTTIRRHPALEPAGHAAEAAAPGAAASAADDDDVLAGTKQVLDTVPTSRDVVRYAAATDDFYEVHYDQDFARERGLPGTITHGLLKLAYLASAAANWGGPGTFVREISASYRGMDLVGERFRVFARLPETDVTTPERTTRVVLFGVSANDQVSTSGSALIEREGV